MWKGILKVAFWGTVGLSTGLVGLALLAQDDDLGSGRLE
jgi:hypothetical protein|tara:strand:+ start:1316 stop:1432 length:117 start_codon:yes stop_codon:yes gene_type:complete